MLPRGRTLHAAWPAPAVNIVLHVKSLNGQCIPGCFYEADPGQIQPTAFESHKSRWLPLDHRLHKSHIAPLLGTLSDLLQMLSPNFVKQILVRSSLQLESHSWLPVESMLHKKNTPGAACQRHCSLEIGA